MSNLRQRLEARERQELENKLDYVPRAIQTAQHQAGAVSSTRSREEKKVFDAAGEEVVRNQNPRTGMGHATGVNTSVRQRSMAQEYVAAETRRPADPDVMSAAMWYQYEMSRQEQTKQRERDEIEAQRKRQQDTAAQQDEARKNLAVNIMLQDASGNEIAQVKALVASNFPADKYSPERHWRILQELRAAVGRS